MSARTQYSLPIATCPHCKAPFEWPEIVMPRKGDYFHCAQCKKTIHITSVETVTTVELGKEPRT